MRIRKPIALGVCTAVLGATAVALLALPASAASNPPWEPDPNALGTLTFYNSAGDVVTSGTNLNHLFDYAEASSTTDPDGASTLATLFFANPQPNVLTANFFNSQASGSTTYPNTSAPAPLNTATNPVVTLTATDADLAAFIPTAVANTQAGYENVYQIRLGTSGKGGIGSLGQGQYWDADVMVNPTAGTWTEIYPVQGATQTSTTTTLSASPTGQAEQGSDVTLTATETAADSTHPAGTVQFEQDDGFNVGSPVPVNSSGVATITTTALLPSPPSGNQLTAVFTPTSSAYSGSTSATLDYEVNPVATKPGLSGPHQVGAIETCNEPTPDFGVNPTYTWLVSGKPASKPSKTDKFTVPGTAYKKALSCRVSESDGTGPVSSATSASVLVSLGKAPKNIKRPALSGPHAVGKVEKVSAGTWSVKGLSFSYQWLLNGKPIKGATKSSLKLSKADNHKTLSCRVTVHATGYANGLATTKGVKVS